MLFGILGGYAAIPAVAAPPDTQLIVNGGFEDGMNNWTFNNTFGGDSATIASVNTQAATGTSSLLVSNRASTGSGPMQITTGTLVDGGVYDVSFKVHYDHAAAPANKTFNLTLRLASATGTSDNNRM